ncbi:hypothetical protein [Chondromyces apiculatus]|nr:hypothetical protein [Chondromyces apiculatus]
MRLMKLLGVLGLVTVGGAGMAAGCGGSEDDGGGTTTTDQGCEQTEPACSVGGCVALKDNAGQEKFGLRMSQLTVTAPEALTNPTVQQIVGQGVLLNLESCRLTGKGTFNWLFEMDMTTSMVRTGGALPRQDPRAGGYCFLDEQEGTFPIKPVTVAYTLADGEISAVLGDLLVPIYEELVPTSTPILLPLKAARVEGLKLSADNNCVGTYNAEGLLPPDRCLPSVDYPAFVDGASLEAHILLEEADQVVVEDLGQSLCVLLGGSGSSDGANPVSRCKRDAQGMIELKGDFCSTTGAAGGCQDSFRLSATFAASAIAIDGICP